MTLKCVPVCAELNNGGRIMADYVKLPINPTAEEINEIMNLLKARFSDQASGLKEQDRYGMFDTSFGLRAVAYSRLINWLKDRV